MCFSSKLLISFVSPVAGSDYDDVIVFPNVTSDYEGPNGSAIDEECGLCEPKRKFIH